MPWSGAAAAGAAGAAGASALAASLPAAFRRPAWARSRAMPFCQMSAALTSSRVTIGPSVEQLLAGIGIVEGGDLVEFLFGEHLRIGECCFLLEIGAARGQRQRLLVDRLADQFLHVRVLLDQLRLRARRPPAAGCCRTGRSRGSPRPPRGRPSGALSVTSCENAGEEKAKTAEAARTAQRLRTRLCNIMIGRTPWFSGGMDGLDAVAAGDDGR